ncbi:hypothetical protein ABZ807_15035 [Micromonospora sp. NPDC047548]|uniref:hypothetical protein n=1 Tax=Micromonospora sp. NPDC047548 TaxID=3155624 RepID=UPI00340C29BD
MRRLRPVRPPHLLRRQGVHLPLCVVVTRRTRRDLLRGVWAYALTVVAVGNLAAGPARPGGAGSPRCAPRPRRRPGRPRR